MSEAFIVKFDQLPEETIVADDPIDASRKVAEIVRTRRTLQALHDEEPVQIKRFDRTAWGRNLTLGAFRQGPVLPTEGEAEGGPILAPSIPGS